MRFLSVVLVVFAMYPNFGSTLESLIVVPLVMKVLQSNGGFKIVLYDFLAAMSLS